jgi:hypothetical protein
MNIMLHGGKFRFEYKVVPHHKWNGMLIGGVRLIYLGWWRVSMDLEVTDADLGAL